MILQRPSRKIRGRIARLICKEAAMNTIRTAISVVICCLPLLGCAKPAEEPTPLIMEKDYSAQLPPGTVALRRITDPLGISLADAVGSISGRRPKRRR